jgi:hypothetical protein
MSQILWRLIAKSFSGLVLTDKYVSSASLRSYLGARSGKVNIYVIATPIRMSQWPRNSPATAPAELFEGDSIDLPDPCPNCCDSSCPGCVPSYGDSLEARSAALRLDRWQERLDGRTVLAQRSEVVR